jgi:hypothetical protein
MVNLGYSESAELLIRPGGHPGGFREMMHKCKDFKTSF